VTLAPKVQNKEQVGAPSKELFAETRELTVLDREPYRHLHKIPTNPFNMNICAFQNNICAVQNNICAFQRFLKLLFSDFNIYFDT